MENQPVTSNVQAQGHSEQITGVPPHGLKREIAVGGDHAAYWVTGVGVALLMSALLMWGVVGIVWLWKRRGKAQSNGSQSLVKTQWQILRDAIDSLSLPPDGDSGIEAQARFAGEASVLLRRALECKTGFPFAERTTDEIKSWSAHGLDLRQATDEAEFFRFLDKLDAVRFAGRVFGAQESESVLADLKTWVKRLEGESRAQ